MGKAPCLEAPSGPGAETPGLQPLSRLGRSSFLRKSKDSGGHHETGAQTGILREGQGLPRAQHHQGHLNHPKARSHMKTEKLFKTPLSSAQMSNSELNLREFREGRTELEASPRRIVFELTNRCNFQCIMCGREAENFQTKDLPVDVVKACEPFYGRTEEVTLHGWGEGTLHPKTAEVLQYLDSFPLLTKDFA